MTALCEAVNAALIRIDLGNTEEWRIVADGRQTCAARKPGLEIRFSLDVRDNSLTSAILLTDMPSERREPLQSHILARLFPELKWQDPPPEASLAAKAAVEAANVQSILHLASQHDVTARDLHHFYWGYNQGYTDSVSI